MFRQALLTPSHKNRTGAPLLIGEVVATAGLRLVIVTLGRTGRLQHASWAVSAWIGAAYWFTASTSFANPAVTISRSLTDTSAGIVPSSVPAFIGAQITGGRSQMAAALLDHEAAGRVRVTSAGLANPRTNSTRLSSRPWPRSASISPARSPRGSPPIRCKRPTS